MNCCGGRRNKWEYTLTKYQIYCKKLWLGGWSYLELSSYHSVPKINEYLGVDIVIKHQINFQTEWMVKAWRISRRGGSLRPARARRSHDDVGIDSVWSKLPPLYIILYIYIYPGVYASEPVACLAWSYPWFVALDRPFDDGCVLKLRTPLWAHPLSANIRYDLIFMFRAKRPVYLLHFRHRRDSRDGCFWPVREEDSRASHKRR